MIYRGERLGVKVTVFDGADCIGGNKIHLDFDGHGIFFDYGLNYKRMGQFYEEFLSPRVGRGVHDHILMGLVPKIDRYRRDLIPSDLDMSSARKVKVDAVFLSHAHMDHVGSVGMLDASIPLITTPVTAALVKGIRDTGQSGFQNEVSSISPRRPSKNDPRVLEADRKENYQGRSFLLPCQCTEELRCHMGTCTTTRQITCGEIGDLDSLKIEMRCHDVDHSIYGASACSVETSSGWVVYSGDLRDHGKFREKTEEFVRAAKDLNPRLLIIEGTRASREDRDEDEGMVMRKCLEAVEEEKGLVVADFAARNFERLDTFADIAHRTGRQLVILSKDAYMLHSLRCGDGVDHMRDLMIYDDLKSKRNGFEEVVETNHADRLLDPKKIAQAPGSYILALSFYDMNKLLDIGPQSGSYIYSSSEAYSEEQVIDFQRLDAWLKMFGLTVKGFQLVEEGGHLIPNFEPGYHASGHASASSLLKMIERIGPEMVMPIHTEAPGFFDQLDGIMVIKPVIGVEYPL